MDGTLTRAVHDFANIRSELGLEPDEMILEAIAKLPKHEAMAMERKLFELELELARSATRQEGVEPLLAALVAAGRKLGIVTRNSKKLASITLEACNLSCYFDLKNIIGRESCAPKPDPAGVILLLEQWAAEPQDTVIVGDYLFDLQVGRRAGICTVHFDCTAKYSWPEYTDYSVNHLEQLTLLVSDEIPN